MFARLDVFQQLVETGDHRAGVFQKAGGDEGVVEDLLGDELGLHDDPELGGVLRVAGGEREAVVVGRRQDAHVVGLHGEPPRAPGAALVAGAPVSVSLIAPRPRFPSGPWCKAGDTVLFSRYAGMRFKIEGVEFRMLADDEITATIPDGAKVGGL